MVNRDRRRFFESLVQRVLAEVEGGRLVERALRRTSVHANQSAMVVAVGKAAPSMACGAVRGGEPLDRLFVLTKAATRPLPSELAAAELYEAGHPLPDERGVRATRILLDRLGRHSERDRVLLLLSGGASALLAATIDGLSLEALKEATSTLLRRGASISEINIVRRHLGAALGGRLAAATRAHLTVLALSDVIGDDPATIGSGPASPDPSTRGDACLVAERHGLAPEVVDHLRRARETPKPGSEIFRRVTFDLLASPTTLVTAVEKILRASHTRVRGRDELVTGPIELLLEELHRASLDLENGEAFLAVGEPTVVVRGPGRGGRAQQLALAMAERIAGASDLVFVACGTDGSDGPTSAAGAIVDGTTWPTALAAGLDPVAALRDFDAHPLLRDLGCTIETGPTGTNLTDFYLVARLDGRDSTVN